MPRGTCFHTTTATWLLFLVLISYCVRYVAYLETRFGPILCWLFEAFSFQ